MQKNKTYIVHSQKKKKLVETVPEETWMLDFLGKDFK